MLIIAGGKGDPDLNWLASAAEHRGLRYTFAYCNSHESTKISWNVNSNTLSLDGEIIDPSQSSLYLRYSMLPEYGEEKLSDAYDLVENWYATLKGWAKSNPEVAMFNRDADVLGINKPYNLRLAEECGFKIAETHVMNNVKDIRAKISDPDEWVIKVPSDGDQTRCLAEVLKQGDLGRVFNARPWSIQRKLNYPEIRVFKVGRWQFAFELNSEKLDVRKDQDNQNLKAIDVPEALKEPMNGLCGRLKLDFAAADFKTCPDSADPVFLEINTAPTFSGYDAKVGGKLSDSMILHFKSLKR